jgi:hypothetical protein
MGKRGGMGKRSPPERTELARGSARWTRANKLAHATRRRRKNDLAYRLMCPADSVTDLVPRQPGASRTVKQALPAVRQEVCQGQLAGQRGFQPGVLQSRPLLGRDGPHLVLPISNPLSGSR